MYPKTVSGVGAHAYSKDGIKWRYTGQAYTARASYDDGTSLTYPYCDRPHLVFDKDGTTPLALTNGVKLGAQVKNTQGSLHRLCVDS